MDFKQRGVLRKLRKDELESWIGPIHYISIHEVYKDEKCATTPVRLVSNSALKHKGRSLNSLLMKGPSALTTCLGY